MEEEPVPSKKRLKNQNDSLKNKKGVNDLMHVSLKQIQMLMTFDKYNLLLSLYIYSVQMFCHKSKGKGRKGDSSSSTQAHSGTSADLFAVMILLNFYLYTLIHYYFIASFDIFYCCFCLHSTSASQTNRRPFLRLWTMRASSRWPECGRRSERPSRRLPRSWRMERPSKRLTRSRTLRTRLMTSHRSPIG
jgi:hypothetical protein